MADFGKNSDNGPQEGRGLWSFIIKSPMFDSFWDLVLKLCTCASLCAYVHLSAVTSNGQKRAGDSPCRMLWATSHGAHVWSSVRAVHAPKYQAISPAPVPSTGHISSCAPFFSSNDRKWNRIQSQFKIPCFLGQLRTLLRVLSLLLLCKANFP